MKITNIHPAYKAMTDEQLKEFIRHKLESHPRWARRALLALYDEQTDAEKEDPTYHVSNGWGFSPQDQEFLSSLAQQALREQTFSMKQLGWLYTLLPKYSGQLVKLIRQAQTQQEIEVDLKRERQWEQQDDDESADEDPETSF
jgi:hypothetical protein